MSKIKTKEKPRKINVFRGLRRGADRIWTGESRCCRPTPYRLATAPYLIFLTVGRRWARSCRPTPYRLATAPYSIVSSPIRTRTYTLRSAAACSAIDTVSHCKIALIECYLQIAIETIYFILSGYHLTGDLTNSILTQLLSFGKREIYVFEIFLYFLLFHNAVHKYP